MSTVDVSMTQATVCYTGSQQVLVVSPVQTTGTFARISTWISGDSNDAFGGAMCIIQGDGLTGNTLATIGWGNLYVFDLSPSTQYTLTVGGNAGPGQGATGTIMVEQFS